MAKIIQFPNVKATIDRPDESVDLNERLRRVRESLKRAEALLQELRKLDEKQRK